MIPVPKENEQPPKDQAAAKKPRKQIKEMEFITVQEFDTIPPYVSLALLYCPKEKSCKAIFFVCIYANAVCQLIFLPFFLHVSILHY